MVNIADNLNRAAPATMLRGAVDQAIFGLVRCWCHLRHGQLWLLTARRTRHFPNPATPVSAVDKFLWRKIFDHNPLFTMACDKLAAKEYALATCPELKTADVLWTGQDPDLIPDHVLAGDVVMKASSGCGWNLMVQGGKVDRGALRQAAREWLARPYGQELGEWGYRDARHCLFVERMLQRDGRPINQEYKFHVVAGQTMYVFVSHREDDERSSHRLDRDGHVMGSAADRERAAADGVGPPPVFDRMVKIAERLAAPFDYIRCDLYALDGEIFFSELTAYPSSGNGSSSSQRRDAVNAQWDLRRSWFLTERQRGWRGVYAAALRRRLDDAGAPRSK